MLSFKREKLDKSKEVILGLMVFGEGSLERLLWVGKHLQTPWESEIIESLGLGKRLRKW